MSGKDNQAEVIRAAGGVIWRDGQAGIEIVLIHRDRYDDWTLPKGKLEKGESWLDAAVREVGEEVGLEVAVGERLPSVRYIDRRSERKKEVRFWLMQPDPVDSEASGDGDEVDEILWVVIDQAPKMMTYEHEADVVRSAAKALRSS